MTTTNRFAIEPLSSFIESKTNPRTIFNATKLVELAESIRPTGVIQPILARPLPTARIEETSKLNPRPTLEIVAGARRYRASKIACKFDIPVMIKDLSDDQVLEIQLIENLQRDDLTDLEAAEGYKKLMNHNNITADEVAGKIGKSRSFVYGCLKLLDLHPFAKQYLRDEFITASAALLIARISDVLLQQKAAIQAAKSDAEGHKPSIRTFQAWLRDNVMLDLSKAPFPIDVKTLTPAGSCKTCTTRTGHDPDLFADVKSDMCTHPPCYHLKAAAHKDALAAQVAAIPQTSNRNVDEQQDLGLVSTLAQDIRKDPARHVEADIATIKANTAVAVDKASRLACCDAVLTSIYDMPDDRAAELLKPELLRAWLLRTVDDYQTEDISAAFDLPPLGDKPTREATDEFIEQCRMRIQRATDANLYRYTAAIFIIGDREQWTRTTEQIKPATLFDAFAADWIDLAHVRKEVADQVEAEMSEKIAALNKQIKTAKPAKTTSTPPPAGAAIGTGEADAKKPKPTASPAGASRKAKTSAEEAKAGIAAAMQGMGSEPLDAALGGSEAAAVQSGVLAVGVTVRVLDGKHRDRVGTLVCDDGNNKWSITLYNALGMPFVAALSTKSLEVVEL